MNNGGDTPRRIMELFLDNATPKESPLLDELVQLSKDIMLSQEQTPASTSQGTQLQRNILKRKLHEEEKLEKKMHKRRSLSTTEQMESMIDISDIPSQLASPDIVIPKRSQVKKGRRASESAAYREVIKNILKANPIQDNPSAETSSLMDSISSPEPNVQLRSKPKTKNRVSTTDFKSAIDKTRKEDIVTQPQDNAGPSESVMDSTNPSSLTSPVVNLQTLRSKPKKRVSTAAFKQALDKTKAQEAAELADDHDHPSLMDSTDPSLPTSPVLAVKRPGPKSKKRISTTAFKQALQMSKALDAARLPADNPSSESPDKDLPANKSSLQPTSPIQQDVNQTTGTIRENAAQSPTSIPETQLPPTVEVQKSIRREQTLGQETIIAGSMLESSQSSVSLSDSSSIASPSTNIIQRNIPKPNKRVSTTGFKEAFDKRKPDNPAPKAVEIVPDSEMSDLDHQTSPNHFHPIASSTQVAPVHFHQTPARPDSLVNEKSTDLSISDIPSELPSFDVGIVRPTIVRKRVSMSEFLTALGQTKTNNLPPSQESGSSGSSASTAAESVKGNQSRASLKGPSVAVVRLSAVSQESNSQSAQPAVSAEFSSLESRSPTEIEKAADSSSRNRSRKSLKFDAPSAKQISQLINSLTEDKEASDSPRDKPELSGSSTEELEEDEQVSLDNRSRKSIKDVYGPVEENQHVSSSNRSRKSIKHVPEPENSPTEEDEPVPLRNRFRKSIKKTADPDEFVTEEMDEVVEKNPVPYDVPVAQEELEKAPSTTEEEDDMDDQNAETEPESEKASSTSSSRPSLQTPVSRYPILKNSTVVAGGVSFSEAPLTMSPISAVERDTPTTVLSTPASSNRKSMYSVPPSPMYMQTVKIAMEKQKNRKEKSLAPSPDQMNEEPPPASKANASKRKTSASLVVKDVAAEAMTSKQLINSSEQNATLKRSSVKPVQEEEEESGDSSSDEKEDNDMENVASETVENSRAASKPLMSAVVTQNQDTGKESGRVSVASKTVDKSRAGEAASQKSVVVTPDQEEEEETSDSLEQEDIEMEDIASKANEKSNAASKSQKSTVVTPNKNPGRKSGRLSVASKTIDKSRAGEVALKSQKPVVVTPDVPSSDEDSDSESGRLLVPSKTLEQNRTGDLAVKSKKSVVVNPNKDSTRESGRISVTSKTSDQSSADVLTSKLQKSVISTTNKDSDKASKTVDNSLTGELASKSQKSFVVTLNEDSYRESGRLSAASKTVDKSRAAGELASKPQKSVVVAPDVLSEDDSSDGEWEDALEDPVEFNMPTEDIPSTSTAALPVVKKSLSASAHRNKSSTSFKGKSISNPIKGKSLFTGSDAISSLFRIAKEDIVDRSKDYVPLDKRLKADAVFQEKVRSQRAILAAKKAAEEAAKKAAAPTKIARAPRKKPPTDNMASAIVNKGNFRFYSRPMKASKEALDRVHEVVGEWFDFTLDQIEIFCANEGIEALETWEHCKKMMISQNIVKDYWEYSALCHELLTNDECAKLLPSSFPPGHYDGRRKPKKK